MDFSARAGETVYNFLERSLNELKKGRSSYVRCTHNGVSITIYRDSYINDLCEKYDLTRALEQIPHSIKKLSCFL
jgi:hypothetical protein